MVINKGKKIAMPIQFLNIHHEIKITGLRHYSFHVPNNEKHAEKCNYTRITKQQNSVNAMLLPFHCPITAHNLNLSWLKILRTKVLISDCYFDVLWVQYLINKCKIWFRKITHQTYILHTYTPYFLIFANISIFLKELSETQIYELSYNRVKNNIKTHIYPKRRCSSFFK